MNPTRTSKTLTTVVADCCTVTGPENKSSPRPFNDPKCPKVSIMGNMTATGRKIPELSFKGVSFNCRNAASLLNLVVERLGVEAPFLSEVVS